MLIRSRAWVRTWTAALAFTATLLACPAANRAEQPGCTALSPSMATAFAALVEKPTAANLQAVRALLAADRAYDPYSDDLAQLDKLLHEGKNHEVIALAAKSQPNLLLSPRAHRLASEAAQKIGDKALAAKEKALCHSLRGRNSRHGRRQRVAPVPRCPRVRRSRPPRREIQDADRQPGAVFRDDKKYDKVLGKDGNTYWFDVGMLFDREVAAQVQSPVARRSIGSRHQAALPAATAGADARAGARATALRRPGRRP